MNHHESAPKHSAPENPLFEELAEKAPSFDDGEHGKHAWNPDPNAENLSVEAITKRIESERAEADKNEHGQDTNTDEVKKPYSFEDSYNQTLNAINKTINSELPSDQQYKDEMNAFDKTFEKFGIPTQEASEDSDVTPDTQENDEDARDRRSENERIERWKAHVLSMDLTPEEREAELRKGPDGDGDVAEVKTEDEAEDEESESSGTDMTLEEYRKGIEGITYDDLAKIDRKTQERWDNGAEYDESENEKLADVMNSVLVDAQNRADHRDEDESDHEDGNDDYDALPDYDIEPHHESRWNRIKSKITEVFKNRDRALRRTANRLSYKLPRNGFRDLFKRGEHAKSFGRLTVQDLYEEQGGEYDPSANRTTVKKLHEDNGDVYEAKGEHSHHRMKPSFFGRIMRRFSRKSKSETNHDSAESE